MLRGISNIGLSSSGRRSNHPHTRRRRPSFARPSTPVPAPSPPRALTPQHTTLKLRLRPQSRHVFLSFHVDQGTPASLPMRSASPLTTPSSSPSLRVQRALPSTQRGICAPAAPATVPPCTDRPQAMDPRVAALVDDPTMGLPHGHPHRPLRRTRRAGPRRRLPQDAAIVSILDHLLLHMHILRRAGSSRAVMTTRSRSGRTRRAAVSSHSTATWTMSEPSFSTTSCRGY